MCVCVGGGGGGGGVRCDDGEGKVVERGEGKIFSI